MEKKRERDADEEKKGIICPSESTSMISVGMSKTDNHH